MENQERHKPQSQEGTGSAENKGMDRSEQKSSTSNMSDEEMRKVADEIGESPDAVTTPSKLGYESGRDDLSGGSGDGMEEQSTGQPTDR